MSEQEFDEVEKPKHYNSHPSGVECVEINENFSGNLAAAIKYCWRDGLKDPVPLKDLKKARWYLRRESGRIRTLFAVQCVVGGSNLQAVRDTAHRVIESDQGLLAQVLGALSPLFFAGTNAEACIAAALAIVDKAIADGEGT